MLKNKKCAICKKDYVQYNSLTKVCGVECSMVYAKNKAEKDKPKIKRLERQKLKDSITGVPELKKLLETQINTICRLLDKGSGCISCGGHTTPAAGHYHSVGSTPALRFNLFNTHLQDFNCNNMRSANLHQYDLGLIKTYGKEYWEMLKFELPLKYPVLKLTKPELMEAIPKAKELVKRLKQADITYSVAQRTRLREEYNNFIGIYAPLNNLNK